jgi:AcrR family transcriptional regulator
MNKQEILDRIEPLFFDRAFAEVSMDDVARSLDIKKASLYYHFPSKDGMFTDLVERSFGRYAPLFESELERHIGEPRQLLDRLTVLPAESRTLFPILTQRGYCRIEAIRDRILVLESQLLERFSAALSVHYGMEPARAGLLFLFVDGLAKRRCLGCRPDRSAAALDEAVRMFFSSQQ